MRVTFSAHVKARMAERGITLEKVQYVLAAPDISARRHDGRTEYGRWVGSRQFKVVVADTEDPAVIVTAFWLDD